MLRADPSSRRTTRTSRDTWFDHLIIAVAFAVLLAGFRTVISGNDWWITSVLVATLTGLTCAVLRAVSVRWVAPIAIVVELLAITWIFVPETLIVVVPTWDTVRGLGNLATAAQEIIVGEQAPVAPAKPIVLVVASSFGLLVVVADSLLQRRRAAAGMGALLVAVFVTPALISGDTPSMWLFGIVAALWLVILRSRTALADSFTRRSRGPAIVLGSAAVAAAIAFPAVSPDIGSVATSWGKPPPAVFGRGINPMLELGQNLRRNGASTALTYTTGLADAPYLKVATLRDFTGKTWRPGSTGRFGALEGDFALKPGIKAERVSTTITIRRLRSTMLPVPYPLYEVTGLEGTWVREPFGLTMRSTDSDTRGQTYSATSLDVQPTAQQLRAITTDVGIQLQEEVRLPDQIPAAIEKTAREVTADATNQYDRVIALQDFLRNGAFTYSETAPVADGYDGNGVDVIAEFLKRRAGYCVHFSSAMAVMARTLGIPSRIAVGYAPGSVAGVRDGQNVYESTSDDLHAWTEIYFPGVGWVRFDPTPGVGAGSAFSEPGVPSSDVESGATPDAERPAVRDRTDGATTTSTTSKASRTAPRTALTTLAGLIVLMGAPALLRGARRRRRLSRVEVDLWWRELEDTARDFGVQFSVADTPRGFSRRLHDRSGMDHEALERLLLRVERARFARSSRADGDGADDLHAVIDSLRAGASGRQRWRATLLPRSLAGRRTYAATAPPPPLAT